MTTTTTMTTMMTSACKILLKKIFQIPNSNLKCFCKSISNTNYFIHKVRQIKNTQLYCKKYTRNQKHHLEGNAVLTGCNTEFCAM